jgi:hypothetical protein
MADKKKKINFKKYKNQFKDEWQKKRESKCK